LHSRSYLQLHYRTDFVKSITSCYSFCAENVVCWSVNVWLLFVDYLSQMTTSSGTIVAPLTEAEFMKFSGIYTPVITPFNQDGSINFDAYVEHVDHLIQNGVQGLVIGGTTGEYYVESLEERIQLLKLAKEHATFGVHIVFGTGSVNPADSIVLAKAAAEYQADAILVATPPYSLPTQE